MSTFIFRFVLFYFHFIRIETESTTFPNTVGAGLIGHAAEAARQGSVKSGLRDTHSPSDANTADADCTAR